MKKALIVLAAAALLAGCDQDRGSSTSSDTDYGSGRGQSDTMILTNEATGTGQQQGTRSLTNEMRSAPPPGQSSQGLDTNELRSTPPPASGQSPQGQQGQQGQQNQEPPPQQP